MAFLKMKQKGDITGKRDNNQVKNKTNESLSLFQSLQNCGKESQEELQDPRYSGYKEHLCGRMSKNYTRIALVTFFKTQEMSFSSNYPQKALNKIINLYICLILTSSGILY